MTRHRLEVLAAFVLGAVLALSVAAPVDGGRHNCKPAWKCTPATAAVTPTPKPATPRPLTAPPVTTAPTAAACSGTLQSRVDAAPSGSTLDLTGCSFTSGATIAKPLTLVGATIATSGRGITLAASNVTLVDLTITGPQATTYNSAQMGIYALATAASPIDNLVIRDSTISRFGHGGIWLRHLTDFSITGNTITDTVYSGIEIISGIRGDVSGNTVQRIGVVGSSANSGNAYGIAITRWTPTTDEPASSDVTVSGNLVENVPTWHGLDTHGGIRVTFSGNTVKGCRDGIYVTGWPSPNRATDVVVDGNLVENTAGSNQYGITSVYSTGGAVRNNTISGWLSGHAILTTSGGIAEATAVNLAVSGNVVS